ncbi:MAG: VOC family protein [Anaerolineales bacterium]|nr:VOC family protein [Anaerolineales bacterium]
MTTEDIYPMPMFVNLYVSDLDASLDWYQKVLGFRIVFGGQNESFAHVRREKYQDLLLFRTESGRGENLGAGIIIQFQAGMIKVDDIANVVREAGDFSIDGPEDRPWNAREVTIMDPDGYRLRFSEPIDMGLSFEEVMNPIE